MTAAGAGPLTTPRSYSPARVLLALANQSAERPHLAAIAVRDDGQDEILGK